MSLRLRLLNRAAAWMVQPLLERTGDVARARRDFGRMARLFRSPPDVLHLVDRGSLPLHWISSRRRHPDWVILYLHGGAYLSGSPLTHRALAGRIARLTGIHLALPAYRLAPEHSAPAAFNDAVAAHARLIALGYPAERIILGGDSAGGGLALALLSHLTTKGLSPAALFAFSPWTDLALTGHSLHSNAARDPLLPASRIPEAAKLILAGLDARDPRISPLYGEFPKAPPVFLQVGRDEILRDDSVRMAARLRAAGASVTLQEWPGCPHVWQMMDGYLPEARQALREVAAFIAPLTRPQSGS